MSKLVLIRHGESVWNKENLFTGWTDVDLSETSTSSIAITWRSWGCGCRARRQLANFIHNDRFAAYLWIGEYVFNINSLG